jgi:hypothetical protein
MAQERSEEHFSELAAGFRAGRIGRRQFIAQAAKLGISVTLLSRVLAGGSARAADDDVLESSPEYPNESPITKERIAFLKSKPYKGTTINILVLKATVEDGLQYWAPK